MSKKSPQLRFEGFTDDWEERKLGDYSENTFGGGTPKTGIDEYWTGDIPWIQSSDLKKEQLYNVQPSKFITDDAVKNSATKLVPKNSIAIVTRVGVGKLALLPFEYATSQDFLSLSNLKVDKWFGIYSTYTMLQKELNNIQGTSIKGITKPELLKKKMRTPSLIDEQSKIGTLFKQLDDIIALHQSKLDLLKEQKKGFLQKMFPKNGAKVPELRFAGFADEWEERKLKELGDIQTGNTPPTSDSDNYSLDGVLWVTPTDIKSLVISNTAKKLSQVGVTKARIAKAGSILVTSIASIGKNTLLRMDAGFNQQINSLTPTSENDSYFLLTQSEKWSEKMKQTAASATMQIVNKTDFSNISTYVPVHKEEQEKIGSFFKQLDDTIALHQRKLDLLKEQKKGYLQKMFPKNGEKVPELRFAGFADDWEERKFSNLAEVRRGLTYKPSDVQKYGIRVLRSSNIAEDTFLIKSDDVFVNKEAVKIDKVKNGDILITSANGSSRLVGKHALIEGIENDTVHGGFMLVARAEKPEFVNAIMSSSWYSKFINIFVSGGNGAIGNLSKSNLEDQKVYVPSEIEQTKIGLFFKGLDDTIALHQRKLDLLKEQKKGYLQKMFSKNGAKVPELRFAGFADDWEERKLSSMTNYKNGKSHEDKQSTSGKLELINLNSISISGGLKHSGKFIDEADDTLQKDDLVMILSDVGHGDLLGRVALIPEDDRFVLNQRVALLRPNTTADPQFLFSYINAHQYYFKAQGAGMSQLNISKGSVENFISFVPIIEEQKKIGAFYKRLDDTIALHQRKLDLLKEQKKGFLQKMFV